MKTLSTILALTLLAMPLTARAEDPHAMHDMKAMGADASEAAKAFADVNMKMHKDMTMEFTGNPDVDFARGMIPHHQGAIDMAKVVLKYGKDPEMKKLAEEIIKAQDTEIAFMKGWLAKQPR
ncbi:MAG: DUF305 domain-containing protein [Hyphomicrobium sp.]|nr:DUF305 domain-containing protein [Hyphomicrobium sp.]